MTNVSKYDLAEQVVRILHGGNPSDDSRMDVREVAMFVEQAFSGILRRRMFENKQDSDTEINGSYVYSFKNVDVELDSDLNQYYSEMPARVVDLPNEIGVQFVGYMKDQKNGFMKVNHNFCMMFKGLKGSTLAGNIGYYTEGDRIYYVNWEENSKPCKVLMKLIVASLKENTDAFSIDECNEFFIPPDMQEEIVAKAVQLYTLHKQINRDVSNDNIDE